MKDKIILFFFDCLTWVRWTLIVIGFVHSVLWAHVFLGSLEIGFTPLTTATTETTKKDKGR